MIENWSGPRPGELVAGFVHVVEGDAFLSLGPDGLLVRSAAAPFVREVDPMAKYTWAVIVPWAVVRRWEAERKRRKEA